MTIDPTRVCALMERERTRFSKEHPRSRELGEQAGGPLLSGVPMNWMTRWPGDLPIWVSEARRARGWSTWRGSSTPTSASATPAR